MAPNPEGFFPFLERMQPVVHDFAGWTDAEMLDLFPDCRLAVLPATRHTEVMQRTDELRALMGPFLS